MSNEWKEERIPFPPIEMLLKKEVAVPPEPRDFAIGLSLDLKQRTASNGIHQATFTLQYSQREARRHEEMWSAIRTLPADATLRDIVVAQSMAQWNSYEQEAKLAAAELQATYKKALQAQFEADAYSWRKEMTPEAFETWYLAAQKALNEVDNEQTAVEDDRNDKADQALRDRRNTLRYGSRVDE